MVEFPGTVMPSRMMLVHDATAAGIPEYAVTWQASDGTLVVIGMADVEELLTTVDGVSVIKTAEEEVTAVAEGTVLVGTAVGIPPFRHVHALEIFAGTFDQRAAYAGKV